MIIGVLEEPAASIIQGRRESPVGIIVLDIREEKAV
jgi:hypothetical protein